METLDNKEDLENFLMKEFNVEKDISKCYSVTVTNIIEKEPHRAFKINM